MTVRLALVGPGDVAHRDYLPELGRLADRAAVVAVLGKGEERARATGEGLAVPWFTDWKEMVGGVEFDAIVNLTPIHDHEAVTNRAFEAGKHVFTEKPLATTAVGASRLVEAARGRGLILVAAPGVMLFPQVEVARRLLADGAIGSVDTARGVALGGAPPWEGYASDPAQFFSAEAGPLVDMGVYALHALTGLLGPVRRVTAMSRRTRERFRVTDGPLEGREVPVEADDAWVVLLEMTGGQIATVEANFTAHGTKAAELELMGSEGTLAMSVLDVSQPVEELGRSGEWVTHPVAAERAAGPDHVLGVEHLVDCIASGRRPIVDGDHAVHVLAVIEAARASAADGLTRDVASEWEGVADD